MPSSSLSSFPSGQSWLSFLVLYLSIPNATTESICSKDILSRGFNQLTPTSPSSTFQSTSHFSGDLRLPYSRLYQCHETKEDGLLYLTKAHTPKCRKVDHVSDDLINQDHSNEDKKSVINCLHESHEHEAAHHHRGDALTRGSILQCDIFWDNDQKNM